LSTGDWILSFAFFPYALLIGIGALLKGQHRRGKTMILVSLGMSLFWVVGSYLEFFMRRSR